MVASISVPFFSTSPLALQLPGHLGKAGLQRAGLAGRRPEPADGGLVRGGFLEAEAAEAAERQPVEQGSLKSGIGKVVERLQIERLHHLRGQIRRPSGRGIAQAGQQRHQRRPVDQAVDPIKPLIRPKPTIDQGVDKAQLADHDPLQFISMPRESPKATRRHIPFAEESLWEGRQIAEGDFRPHGNLEASVRSRGTAWPGA